MPTYDYECSNCGHIFEMFQSITAKPKRKPDEPCAKCGQRAAITRQIGGGGAVIFKGSGFYETDYRSESYKKAAKAESESNKPKVDTDGSKDKSVDKPTEKTTTEKAPDTTTKSPRKSKSGAAAESSTRSKKVSK